MGFEEVVAEPVDLLDRRQVALVDVGQRGEEVGSVGGGELAAGLLLDDLQADRIEGVVLPLGLLLVGADLDQADDRGMIFSSAVIGGLERSLLGVDDSEARLTALYKGHYRSVLSYVLLRAEQQEAEDIASETFLIAWRRLERLPEPPLPWLLGVARNLLRTQRRSRLRGQGLVERLAELAPAGDVAERVAERQAALNALADLSERDVEAVLLISWYGLSPAEAAKIAGCSARTFNVRLHRARRRLAGALGLSVLAFQEQS